MFELWSTPVPVSRSALSTSKQRYKFAKAEYSRLKQLTGSSPHRVKIRDGNKLSNKNTYYTSTTKLLYWNITKQHNIVASERRPRRHSWFRWSAWPGRRAPGRRASGPAPPRRPGTRGPARGRAAAPGTAMCPPRTRCRCSAKRGCGQIHCASTRAASSDPLASQRWWWRTRGCWSCRCCPLCTLPQSGALSKGNRTINKLTRGVPRGNDLLEICTPDIKISTWYQSVHRISGWQLDISGIINGYKEKIDQISIKYLTDFGRISTKKNQLDIPKY